MTIATALRCEDGVILCADSLISGGDVNDVQRKIVAFNATNLHANVAIAFAGSVPHCWSVIKSFARRLNAMPASEDLLDAEAFETVLTEVLEEFYRKHIYSHPGYPYGTGPAVDLIAVLQHRKGGFASIFTTWETIVNQQAMYAFIGSGASFAKHIVDPLITVSLAGMKRKHVLLLADHMLRQTKRYIPGVGDQSQFFFVANRLGFCEPSHQSLLPDERSDTFARIVADLFYASADLDLEDDLVRIGLHLTDRRLEQIRAEQRSEKERRDKLGPAIFDYPLIGIGPTPVEPYTVRPAAENDD